MCFIRRLCTCELWHTLVDVFSFTHVAVTVFLTYLKWVSRFWFLTSFSQGGTFLKYFSEHFSIYLVNKRELIKYLKSIIWMIPSCKINAKYCASCLLFLAHNLYRRGRIVDKHTRISCFMLIYDVHVVVEFNYFDKSAQSPIAVLMSILWVLRIWYSLIDSYLFWDIY